MDFASALADLEKTAAAAASSNAQSSSSSSSSRNNATTSSASALQEQRPDHKRRGRPGPHPPHDSYHRRSQRPRYNDHHHHHRSNNNHHHHRSSPLDAMIRFGYRVQPYRPPPPPAEGRSSGRPFHIALLCLSIDDLPYEHIWRAWSQTGGGGNNNNNNNALVSLICHAKFPSKISSPWLKQRLLTKPPRLGRGNSYADPEYLSYQPEWGSIQITRAMIRTLIEGMKIGAVTNNAADGCEDARFSTRRFLINENDRQRLPNDDIPPVDSFIFISETCIPVRTLAEFEQLIYGEQEVVDMDDMNTMDDNNNDNNNIATTSIPRQDVSWIHARSRNTPGTPQNKYERDQFLDIHRMIPQHYRWKSDQWLLLSRPHAAAVLDIDKRMRPSDQLWNSFAKVAASDEMYFATALAVLGILKEEDDDDNNNNPHQIVNRRITYVDWSEGMRNPASFGRGLKDLQKVGSLARAQGCLFARKFVPVLPGQQETTGQISVEEWKNAIEQMAQAEAKAKADQDAMTNNTQHELESKGKAEQEKTEEAQHEAESKAEEDQDETNKLQE